MIYIFLYKTKKGKLNQFFHLITHISCLNHICQHRHIAGILNLNQLCQLFPVFHKHLFWFPFDPCDIDNALLDSIHQLLKYDGFEQIIHGAIFDRAFCILKILKAADKNKLRVQIQCSTLPDNIDSSHSRHGDVKQRQLRMYPHDCLKCTLSLIKNAHDLDPQRSPVHQFLYSPRDHNLVIRQYHLHPYLHNDLLRLVHSPAL